MVPVIILTIEDESDREFMTRLYLDNERIMYSEMRKMGADSWIMDDVLQDSLIRLIDKIDILRGLEQRKQVNYIITTVRNQLKNYYRKKQRITIYSLDDENSFIGKTVSAEDNIEVFVFQKEQVLRLRSIWPLLSESTQQLLERKYILGQSNEEIADVFQVKPESIRMKLSRARKEALMRLQEYAVDN